MNRRSWPLWLELLFVIVLTALALFVRVYHLRDLPPGLWLDEAANGIDILQIFKGVTPIFFENNSGREPLFLYLQAISVGLLGATPFALRLTAAMIGAATVPTTYWMVREAFAKTTLPANWLALWTASFLTFSYWHISLSRLGLRAIMLPLVATITFAWFWRAWHKLDTTNKLPWLDLILCGVSLGVGLYTYTASRFIPVLLVLVAVVSALLPVRSAGRAKRIGLSVAVTVVASAIVFAPLAIYYMGHSGAFLGHASSISVFSTEFTGKSPISNLTEGIVKTAGMFVVLKDQNLRHNPAARPLFDVLLAAWLFAGLVLAIVRWRTLPYFFAVAWFILLSLPAILTAEGVPHSLRSVGMIPIACLLPTLAMLTAGKRLSRKLPILAFWLPLPFLLFSAYTSLHSYFGAWQDPSRFREYFLTDYEKIGSYIKDNGRGDGVWILSRFSESDFSGAAVDTIRFWVQDKMDLGAVTVDEEEAPEQLSALTRDKEKAYLLEIQDWTGLPDAYYDLVDPKHMIDFLLRKYGRVLEQENGDPSAGITHTTYALPSSSDYLIAKDFAPTKVSFDNRIELTELAYGRTALDLGEPASALENKTVPSGHSLWAVAHWGPQVELSQDLKASLILRDEFGHLAGQADSLLVSDEYPGNHRWIPGASSGTYHILPTLPGIPPGRYNLYLKVYEEQTGQVYPVIDQTGAIQGTQAQVGSVEVTRPAATQPVSPTNPLPAAPALTPELALLGYDLPSRTIYAGNVLPFTLYWQTLSQPNQDYVVGIELRNQDGVVVQHLSQPANGTYPTTQWKAGDIVRDWQDVKVPATTPAGAYDMFVTMSDGEGPPGEVYLERIEVKNRPRCL